MDMLNQDWTKLDNKVGRVRLHYWGRFADFCVALQQLRFVMEIINGKLIVQNRKKTDILAELKRRDYVAFAKGQGSPTAGDSPVTPSEDGDESDEDAAVETASGKGAGIRGYDYLLSMPIWNLTLEYVGVLCLP